MKSPPSFRLWTCAGAIAIIVFSASFGVTEAKKKSRSPKPKNSAGDHITSWTEQLFDAVKDDDVEWLAMALKSGGDINHRSEELLMQTPLMHAALQNKPKTLKFLLENGADPTIGEAGGFTPMHGAGYQGSAEAAKILIDWGLDPNEPHESGFSPFHRSCWGAKPHHTETARVFLEAGVDPSVDAKNGETSYNMAEHNPSTQLLIEEYMNKQGTSSSLRDEL